MMLEMFKEIDTNGDGFLSLDEIRAADAKEEHPVPDEELVAEFNKYDANADGKISYQEFLKPYVELRRELEKMFAE